MWIYRPCIYCNKNHNNQTMLCEICYEQAKKEVNDIYRVPINYLTRRQQIQWSHKRGNNECI